MKNKKGLFLTVVYKKGLLTYYMKICQDGSLRILVCTDYASRGLDLPFVKHVVQAQFASNVVQHMHRIGRASRAGSYGRATNLYGSNSIDLVNSILSDNNDKNVDQSFSRRRGFRNKLKKQKKREGAETET